MNEKEIETLVRELIKEHLADETREAALDWLEKRVLAYQSVQELELLDDEDEE